MSGSSEENLLDKEKLRQAQMIMLYIMKRIHEVCVKHKIKYWLDYGTLLGAIRHDGFIPWDDDMDICMLREDYERFSKIAQAELGEEFFWQTRETEPDYYFEVGKVRLNGTLWLERNWAKSPVEHQGLFVDVFPIDPFPESKWKMLYLTYKSTLYNVLLFYKVNHTCSRNFFKNLIIFFFSAFTSKKGLSNWFVKTVKKLQKYKNKSSKVAKLFDGTPENWCDRSIFDNVILKEFEDAMFYIPARYEERLTGKFGDYMQLPPENKRYGHHNIIEFDFGKYKSNSNIKGKHKKMQEKTHAEINREDLCQAQKIMLYIMKHIHDVCEKNHIKYWLDYGTLLGAIRHDGFIPWDGDMDICMMREDYERFSKIAQEELGEEFFWQTKKTDPAFYYGYGKVRLNGTLWMQKRWKNTGLKHHGIFVDIFPIDPFPKQTYKVKLLVMLRFFIFSIYEPKILKNYSPSLCRRLIQKILVLLISRKTLDWMWDRIINHLQKYSETNMVSMLHLTTELCMCQCSLFEKLLLKKFEKEEFYIPARYDERLSKVFGDYMQPPPEDQRYEKHNIIKIDFGKYKSL